MAPGAEGPLAGGGGRGGRARLPEAGSSSAARGAGGRPWEPPSGPRRGAPRPPPSSSVRPGKRV